MVDQTVETKCYKEETDMFSIYKTSWQRELMISSKQMTIIDQDRWWLGFVSVAVSTKHIVQKYLFGNSSNRLISSNSIIFYHSMNPIFFSLTLTCDWQWLSPIFTGSNSAGNWIKYWIEEILQWIKKMTNLEIFGSASCYNVP